MAGVWKGSEVFPERIVLEHLRLLCMVDSGLSSEGQKTSKDQAWKVSAELSLKLFVRDNL